MIPIRAYKETLSPRGSGSGAYVLDHGERCRW
jgi:hypothetical protein